MSDTHPAPSSCSNFQLIFNNALKAYEKHTKKDLLAHPLAAQFQNCDSPTTILAVLQQQVQELNKSRSSNERLTKWLDPTVNVLYALSGTLGEGISLVFSPAKVIFAGAGVLLSAAKDVQASHDTLVDIFERIENFFRRLENYTEVPPTPQMMDIIGKIMVEVLSILAIATKEIKQGRTKKYMKKLLGRNDVEDALKRLDKLTHEEARMATAQVLKITHAVEGRVAIVDERVKDVADMVAEVIDDGNDARMVMQQTADGVEQMRRSSSPDFVIVDCAASCILAGNQLWDNLHNWLSPSDPSTNHNIACGTRQKRTANWFFQGRIFKSWKSTESLLWIHGKPGSGKSVLCSTIIQDIEAMHEAGQASMAYFYFDFRNANKQHLHDLVPSLLTQLSTSSDTRRDILSRLYEAHDRGRKQPSEGILTQCLKEILKLPEQLPIYIILDAIDECPNTSGIPSPREQVLELISELAELRISTLHICITSRPEIDIREVLEPLTSRRISLHDQSGQKEDIAEYVRSVVYSDSEPIMKRWRREDKELVIQMLSERADGMFRWVFCQLEILRHCLPSSVRRTLQELPESLDETYERVLREIKKSNRDHAHRLLQCLVVAVRPLRIDELTEVLAIDFDDEEGIPKLKESWRWENQEQALLSSCSSLIAIVDGDNDSRVVQFSHFSVKEFLTSPRLAAPTRDVSRYYIILENAHTIMAQACLSVLLQLGDRVGENVIGDRSPLVQYSAEHWVAHAQVEKVSSHVQKPMECLFDLGQPYFAAWRQLYDIDGTFNAPHFSHIMHNHSSKSAAPLYYAALCGFQDLVDRLIVMYPEHLKTNGGRYGTPALAALAGKHFDVAELLYHNGSSVDFSDVCQSPLHSAAYNGDLKMVQVLLEYKANPNSKNSIGGTPLHGATNGYQHPIRTGKRTEIVRLLLEYGANPNLGTYSYTPLHFASEAGNLEVVRALLEYGADIEPVNGDGKTAFQVALEERHDEIMKMLSDHGAQDMAVLS